MVHVITLAVGSNDCAGGSCSSFALFREIVLLLLYGVILYRLTILDRFGELDRYGEEKIGEMEILGT